MRRVMLIFYMTNEISPLYLILQMNDCYSQYLLRMMAYLLYFKIKEEERKEKKRKNMRFWFYSNDSYIG